MAAIMYKGAWDAAAARYASWYSTGDNHIQNYYAHTRGQFKKAPWHK